MTLVWIVCAVVIWAFIVYIIVGFCGANRRSRRRDAERRRQAGLDRLAADVRKPTRPKRVGRQTFTEIEEVRK